MVPLFATIFTVCVTEVGFLVWCAVGKDIPRNSDIDPSGPGTVHRYSSNAKKSGKQVTGSAWIENGRDRRLRTEVDNSDINKKVQERLAVRRGDKREHFLNGFMQRVEKEVGRSLTPKERGVIACSFRNYFAETDERDEREGPRERAQRISVAARARTYELVRLLGSEEDAERVFAEEIRLSSITSG